MSPTFLNPHVILRKAWFCSVKLTDSSLDHLPVTHSLRAQFEFVGFCMCFRCCSALLLLLLLLSSSDVRLPHVALCLLFATPRFPPPLSPILPRQYVSIFLIQNENQLSRMFVFCYSSHVIVRFFNVPSYSSLHFYVVAQIRRGGCIGFLFVCLFVLFLFSFYNFFSF